MPILRIKKRDNPFVQIDKRPINDERLSWKAKGILVYLLSKPDDWKVWIKDLVKRAHDGKASVRSGIQELMDAGYVARHQGRTDDNRWGEVEYTVREVPLTGFQEAGNQDPGNQEAGNRTYTKNDLTNTDQSENEVTDSEADASVTPPTPTLFTTLAEICQIDIDKKMITSKQRGQLNTESKRLREAGIDCADVEAFGRWWWEYDWRGQKGQPPHPSLIRAMWMQYKNWKPGGNGALPRGRSITDEDRRRYVTGEFADRILS